MTEELITVLAKNSGLRVISRTSAMHYKKADRPLPDIARELGGDGILEGSVGRSGGRVHANVEFIHEPSDTHLWAESYDRDLSDVGALQNELARTITGQIGHRVASSHAPERRISPEAHDQYLLGKYYWYANHYEKAASSSKRPSIFNQTTLQPGLVLPIPTSPVPSREQLCRQRDAPGGRSGPQGGIAG